MNDELQEAIDAIEQDYLSFRDMRASAGTFNLDDIGLVLGAARAATERLTALEAWAREAYSVMREEMPVIDGQDVSLHYKARWHTIVDTCPIQVEKETDQ